MYKVLISLKNLYTTLNQEYKSKFYLLIFLMVVNSFLEIISLGSIIPLISSILDPNFFDTNIIGMRLSNFFPSYDNQMLILIILIFFSVIIIISGIFKTLLLWITTKFNADVGISLSNKIYTNLLYFSYKDFISKNSNKIISDVANKITTVIFFIIFPSLLLMTAVIQIFGIFIFLMTINFYLIFSIMIFFFISYYFTFSIVKKKLFENSKAIANQEVSLVKQIQDGFGSKKIIMINNLQNFFFENFKNSNTELRNSQASNTFLNILPKYIIETFAIIILSVIIYLLLSIDILDQNNAQTIALIGLLGFSAQKLMPLIQQTYVSISRVIGSYDSLLSVNNILSLKIDENKNINKQKRIEFKRFIELKNISFSYNSEKILKNINLKIKKGEKIGLVGITGSGKSTLADILSGLLRPNYGSINIDGINLNIKNINLWQKNISIVPQHIYLSDDTIQNNIAYSINKNSVNRDLINFAINKAGLNELVKEKKKGIFAKIGERGINLSGGQRQKIAIARAFYRKAAVIILDEATSSLDNKSEQEIIKVLKKLGDKTTLIIISHKVETLKFCDKIIELENGKIKFFDKYEALVKKSNSFKKLIFKFNQ